MGNNRKLQFAVRAALAAAAATAAAPSAWSQTAPPAASASPIPGGVNDKNLLSLKDMGGVGMVML